MEKVRVILKRIVKSQDFVLICISIFMGMMMLFIKTGADDINAYQEGTIRDCWNRVTAEYYTWTSRQVVNCIALAILQKGKKAFAIYMSTCIYVFAKALLLLCSYGKNNNAMLYVIAMIPMFPWNYLVSAGWIITSATYFGPQAFALMSLVPIKKVLNNEKIKWWETILYVVCLIYGTNVEQMCVVVLILYVIATIYFIIVKKSDWRIWLQLLLSLVSLCYIITCPGNRNRDISEEMSWFPTYGMMGTIDKADIGLSTTLRWLFVDSNLFIILLCIFMTIFVWKKYNDTLYRIISCIPSTMVLLLGPLKNVLSTIFPYAMFATHDIDYYGAFNVNAQGRGSGVLQFGLFLAIAFCIIVNIILLNESVEGFIADISLILMGVASRCMMGFSPTVYASDMRTYTTLIMCLMVVSVHLFNSNCYLLQLNGKQTRSVVYNCIIGLLIILGVVNFMFLVGTAWH